MKLQKIIVVLGPPGSGKGTQSKLLANKLGFTFFSMGDTLRQYAKKDNPLGKEIRESIENGKIVPDAVVNQVVTESFNEALNSQGLVLEGYPRTQVQMEILDEFMKNNNIADLKALVIEVEKNKLLTRLSLRKTCPTCQAMYKPGQAEYESNLCSVCGSKIAIRTDDQDTKFVEKRFSEFEEKTAKIINYYNSVGKLVRINGDHSSNADESIKGVHQEILDKLGITK